MLDKSLVLFSFDLYRVSPETHDAACHAYERDLRANGLLDHLDFAARGQMLTALGAKEFPWAAQCCGRVKVALEGHTFVATLYLAADVRPVVRCAADSLKQVARLELGNLTDDLKALRESLHGVTEWADQRLPGTIYQDTATYETLIERFDLKAFRADYLRPAESRAGADRSRHWN